MSPAKYVQGKGLLEDASHIQAMGKKPLLLCDDIVWNIVGAKLKATLEAADLEVLRVPFNGEASEEEISRVSKIGRQEEVDVVLALGGGKAIDAGKGISDVLGIPIVVIPTIASTDAPTSALSVIYSPEGSFEKYLFYQKNPDLVLVDTRVIAQAPSHLLASGIGDALATWVELRAVTEAYGTTMAGGVPSLAALAIAKKCEETLFEYGLQAMAANEVKVVTPAFDAVVEANTLLSGLGFESGGLAAAHAIHNGFTALEGPVHEKSHGEKVAYGTLTQLFLENRPKEEIDRYIAFYQALNLPTTLAELNLGDADEETLLKIGRQATIEGETIHQMAFEVTAQDIADALRAADVYVRSLEE